MAPLGNRFSYTSSALDSESLRTATEFNGHLYFIATDGVEASRLWKTDGTDAGTVLVKEIGPASSTGPMTSAGGTLFFSGVTSDYNAALWKSDGTTEGTVPVQVLEFFPRELVPLDASVFFTADDDRHMTKFWRADGNEIVLVKSFPPNTLIRRLLRHGSHLFVF